MCNEAEGDGEMSKEREGRNGKRVVVPLLR